jgi:hypothetical protein
MRAKKKIQIARQCSEKGSEEGSEEERRVLMVEGRTGG